MKNEKGEIKKYYLSGEKNLKGGREMIKTHNIYPWYKHIEISQIAHLTVQFWTNLLHPGGPVGAEQAHGDNKHNYHSKAQPWNNSFFVL